MSRFHAAQHDQRTHPTFSRLIAARRLLAISLRLAVSRVRLQPRLCFCAGSLRLSVTLATSARCPARATDLAAMPHPALLLALALAPPVGTVLETSISSPDFPLLLGPVAVEHGLWDLNRRVHRMLVSYPAPRCQANWHSGAYRIQVSGIPLICLVATAISIPRPSRSPATSYFERHRRVVALHRASRTQCRASQFFLPAMPGTPGGRLELDRHPFDSNLLIGTPGRAVGLLIPFTPVAVLDPERLKIAAERLCRVFGVESLHPHQEEAGQNILKGISTLLDVPTGGGKALAFWYALPYHWQPGNTEKDCQKIVLVVGPLVALMEERAKGLNAKGIPAIAITSNSPNLEQSLTDLGQNKYRVGFVGPEMALSTQFHEKVLNQVEFTRNIICLVIDELHCVWEWGNDDFRPEYRQIVQLSACLPTGLPILGASATVPYHVIKDILANLGLPADCARVEVSNEKLNVFLSIRILQHEPEPFADLLVLFSDEAEGPEDFLQTLIYANDRQEVEKIQDFLRDNAPSSVDGKKAFEFYHRHIDEDQKENIQTRIKSGELRGVPTTDALGLGMDFQTIMRVLMWMKPRSFLSLVQKIGRCVRDRRLRGEAALYITKAMYTRCCAELEILSTEKEAAGKEDSAAGSDDEENSEEPPDRDLALALQNMSDEEEEVAAAPVKRRRKGKGKPKNLSPMEERDQRYFLEYITTTKCRRLVWNRYFGNQRKKRLNISVPEVGDLIASSNRSSRADDDFPQTARGRYKV
ncbi:P-loop containing nucleoside triphosphate hydrolase protein [Mycena metata]|uniref:DNA 3'-5' helicase n=1 Tax=Mycena metata TaxID=1033252 RepID=A0AAD7ID38_9AGAR|nr:P-loop containing nucleoside triphosphate hydrolase protein [Mycena metata]